MQLAVSGADTLATARRFRSEDLAVENTLAGALNRFGRMVLGRLDYGVGLSSDVYMKAYNFIRQHHPALMTKLAPVFEFIDRMRNTGGSLRHRIETEGVAAFQLLGSLLNDIATATQPGQLGPAFAMAGHSGGSGSGGGSTPVASSGGGLGGAGGVTNVGNNRGVGIGQNSPPVSTPTNPPGSYKYIPKRYKKGQSEFLEEHEKYYLGLGPGGHTLKKHVGKTIRQLRRRFTYNLEVRRSSSFPDAKTAEWAIKEALRINQKKIFKMLEKGNAKTNFVVDLYPNVTGILVDRATRKSHAVSKVHVEIRADQNSPGGYYILTGFPSK